MIANNFFYLKNIQNMRLDKYSNVFYYWIKDFIKVDCLKENVTVKNIESFHNNVFCFSLSFLVYI